MRPRILHRSFVSRKIVNFGMALFAVFGIGMLAGGGFLATSILDFLAVAEQVEGEVIDLIYRRSDDGGSYAPSVRFRTLSGEEISFTSRVGSNPSFHSRGDPVTVLYDPQAPHNARINHFFQLWFVPILMGVMGCAFSGAGIGYCGLAVRRGRRDAWLSDHGERISARIVDIARQRFGYSVNDQYPWRIRAEWRDPTAHTVHVFNSRALWFDPSPFLQGAHIDVIIDRQNPGRYKFDLSLLPQE